MCKSKKLKHPLCPGRHVLRPEGVYTTAVGGPARAREPERVPLDGRRDFPFGFARESLETGGREGTRRDARPRRDRARATPHSEAFHCK